MVELFMFKDRFDVFKHVMSEYGLVKYYARAICCGLCVFDGHNCNFMCEIDKKQYCSTTIY